MKNDHEIDPELTQQLRQGRNLDITKARTVHSFRPILQVQLLPTGEISGLISIVKFNYQLNGNWVWTWLQPQQFEVNSMFYPDVLLNLDPYRSRNRMVGVWEVTAEIAFVRERQLANIPSGRKRDFLMNLTYQDVASFRWEISPQIDSRLTPTGERTTGVNPERLSQVTVSMEDI